MRFLANENVPRSAVEALRADGHDVSWIRSDAPGLTDEAVLARARADARVLLTFDKDFGELVLKLGASASYAWSSSVSRSGFRSPWVKPRRGRSLRDPIGRALQRRRGR